MTAGMVVHQESGIAHQLDKIYAILQRYTAPGQKPRCMFVVLTHAAMTPQGGYANETLAEHRWLHLKNEQMLTEEVAQKAQEFFQAAKDHADNFDRSQRYSITCYGQAADHMLFRHEFRLAPSQTAMAMFGETEPATGPGVLALALHYNEVLSKSTFTKDSDLFSRFATENESLRAENARLRQENAEMRREAFMHMKATQEMMMAKAQMELAKERDSFDEKKMAAKRSEELWGLFSGSILPKMVENVTGSPMMSQAAGPLLNFLKNIPREKVTAMMSHLSEDEFKQFQTAIVPHGTNGVG